MTKIDRRIKKSQKSIWDAFISLLLDEGFDQITVKAITEKADICRKTFYLHYEDKYALLNTLVQRQLEELELICEQKKDMEFIEGTIIWFKYFEEHKDLLGALFLSDSTFVFRKQLLNFMMNETDKKMLNINPAMDKEIVGRFLSSGMLGIIESYVIHQSEVSVDHMARQVGELTKMICSVTNLELGVDL